MNQPDRVAERAAYSGRCYPRRLRTDVEALEITVRIEGRPRPVFLNRRYTGLRVARRALASVALRPAVKQISAAFPGLAASVIVTSRNRATYLDFTLTSLQHPTAAQSPLGGHRRR